MDARDSATVFVAATSNKHKIEEIADVMRAFGITILSKDEAGVADFEIAESGATFEENAHIKAKAVSEHVDLPVIADDSGLMTDALDGAPGVYSARFSEKGTEHADAKSTDADARNNAKLLELMKDVPDGERGARFAAVVEILYPDGEMIVARGECEGRILREPRGMNGFGYDPLFVPRDFEAEGLTFAQLPPKEKNAISHRAKALAALRDQLAARKSPR
ncbi:MAG: RdgB/HAM1 family non-canonical purine NTP pyrophosphatase [Clostridiales Family XIII bacterium]|jgi:XTP/dITP diphosphohydrolase|nr:RdgB/HAM1 family non-canonical purine NTP pyrophosphatase [Clostridiales Family XIII bacterium]